jgi:hypothetical protein
MKDYLTAEQLEITPEEWQALIRTIDVLRAEQISFDMGNTCTTQSSGEFRKLSKEPTYRCDTNCCIGGSMSLLMQNAMQIPEMVTPAMGDVAHRFTMAYDDDGVFHSLFFDNTSSDDPREGIAAIERFLRGNTEDPWLTN